MAERLIILDTETTGLSPESGDRVIEIAALEMMGRHLTGRNLHLLINPERDVPEEAYAIHHISTADLVGKPVFAKVADEIAAFLSEGRTIIHNAPFDVGFLQMEFARLGMPLPASLQPERVIDTLAIAKERYPGQRNSLDALCLRFEIDRSRRVYHGALIDCELLSEVYLVMTREQFDLSIEDWQHDDDALRWRPAALKVRTATAEEEAGFVDYVEKMAAATKKPALYQMFMQAKDAEQ